MVLWFLCAILYVGFVYFKIIQIHWNLMSWGVTSKRWNAFDFMTLDSIILACIFIMLTPIVSYFSWNV